MAHKRVHGSQGRKKRGQRPPPVATTPIPRELTIDPEVTVLADELADAEDPLLRRVMADPAHSPKLSAGDLDAAWDAGDTGEETVGGSAPTPDQDNVDEIGAAVGLEYQDDEPLAIDDKLEKRDNQRWELDPASAEDYEERARELAETLGRKRRPKGPLQGGTR